MTRQFKRLTWLKKTLKGCDSASLLDPVYFLLICHDSSALMGPVLWSFSLYFVLCFGLHQIFILPFHCTGSYLSQRFFSCQTNQQTKQDKSWYLDCTWKQQQIVLDYEANSIFFSRVMNKKMSRRHLGQ